jgi:hypothetical protein
MVWSVPFQRSRAAEGPQNVFASDLAHELPLTICTQQDKCLSQPLLTVIAVDRESDVTSSENQSRAKRRKWLVCPELGVPFCVVGMESREIRLDFSEHSVDRFTTSVVARIFPLQLFCFGI